MRISDPFFRRAPRVAIKCAASVIKRSRRKFITTSLKIEKNQAFFVFSVAKPIPNAQKGSGRSYEKEKKKKHSLGTRLLGILDNWDSHKEDIANKPDPYLYQLEEFFRKFHV
jgi:hypothetical protein